MPVCISKAMCCPLWQLQVIDTVVLEVCSIVSLSKHNKMYFALSALQRSGLCWHDVSWKIP